MEIAPTVCAAVVAVTVGYAGWYAWPDVRGRRQRILTAGALLLLAAWFAPGMYLLARG